jgi:hypothetical protein
MSNKTSSERVSIKNYHLPYLHQIGEQIGTDDLSEIINYVLAWLKQGGYGMPHTQALTTAENLVTASPTAALVDDDALAESLGDLLAA